MTPYTPSGVFQVSERSQTDLKNIIYMRRGAYKISAYERLHILRNQFGILSIGLPESWNVLYTGVYGASIFMLVFSLSQVSLHVLQLFRSMLHHCFAVKLQKCFVDCKTPTDFSVAGW